LGRATLARPNGVGAGCGADHGKGAPVIVDSAIYVDGQRLAGPRTLQETYKACRAQQGMAWIGLYKPTEEEFASVAREFELHELAVEVAIRAHQRPKVDRNGETLFVVLNAARYADRNEVVEFGEIHVFAGDDFVVTVRHAESPNLALVRRRMEEEPELLGRGSRAVLYAILDRVVDDYGPVVAGLENDIDEIENVVFSGNADVSRRTYELTREVIDFQRAVKPVPGLLTSLIARFERTGKIRSFSSICAMCRIRVAGPGAGGGISGTVAEHFECASGDRGVAAE
jgi:magnesium transporter